MREDLDMIQGLALVGSGLCSTANYMCILIRLLGLCVLAFLGSSAEVRGRFCSRSYREMSGRSSRHPRARKAVNASSLASTALELGQSLSFCSMVYPSSLRNHWPGVGCLRGGFPAGTQHMLPVLPAFGIWNASWHMAVATR